MSSLLIYLIEDPYFALPLGNPIDQIVKITLDASRNSDYADP
jgi:hypothetical protein